MRGLLVILGLVVLAAAAALQFRIVTIGQTRPAVVQAPEFKADVARVSVGERNVTVPTIDVQKPAPTPAP